MGRARSTGLFAGMVGGIAMASVQVIGRFSLGTPTFFDLAENSITRAIPPVIFGYLLDRLQFSAKPLLFGGLILAQVFVGGLLGLFWPALADSRLTRHQHGLPLTSLVYAGVLSMVTGLVILPIVGQGVFGTQAPNGPIVVSLTLLIGYAIYALVLAAIFDTSGIPARTTRLDSGRRRLLSSVVAGTVLIAIGDAALHLFGENSGAPATTASGSSANFATGLTLVTAAYPLPPPAGDWMIPGLSSEITPVKDFYVVSKNLFSDPHLDARRWSLQIDGLVDHRIQLTYANLLSLPAVEFYQTLECISNEIGGDLISTAWWRGVRLKDLLTMAGANPRTVKVVFHAADDYADSVPLAVALDPRAALVYQMNRALLPVEHGYPARILVPGRYGIKNVKWVTRIELVAEDFKGYWQQRGWTDDGRIHTMSRIDVPKDHALVNAGRTTIAGIAFAGDRGISRVQISVDEGKTWQDALLKSPLASLAWRLWQYQWDAPPGNGSIFVQATDGTGRVQWPLPQDTVPDGATGQDVHVVRVK